MLVELAIVLLAPPLVLVPHLLPLHRVAPSSAATVWLLALGLRAMIAVGAAVFLFLFLPGAGLFHVAKHWCFHTLVPFLTEQFGLRGHSLADIASLLPGLTLAASLVWVAFGLARGSVALQLFLRRRRRGDGPLGSTIVDEDAVFVAVAGVGRGEIVISRAALETFDGEEIAASVAHERGHLRRRHRPVLVVGRILAALGRPIPGTRTAERELGFSLERDADEFAVRETSDPLALASAICKATAARAATPSAIALLGRGSIVLRLEYLMNGGQQRAAAGLERAAHGIAAALAVSVLVLAVAVPTVAFSAAPSTTSHLVNDCAN